MDKPDLHTFLFADIAGYSLVADQDGDEAAADLALYFLSRASSIANDYGAEVIKSLGDAVMIHAQDAAASIALALDLLAEFGDGSVLPPVHAGLQAGHIASARWRGLEPLQLKNIRLPVQVYAASRIPARLRARDLVVTFDAPLPAGQAVTA